MFRRVLRARVSFHCVIEQGFDGVGSIGVGFPQDGFSLSGLNGVFHVEAKHRLPSSKVAEIC